MISPLQGEEFTNKQIDLATLPSVNEVAYKGLDKEYLTVGILSKLIFWTIVCAGILMVLFFRGEDFPRWSRIAALLTLALIVTSSFVVEVKGFKRKLYAIREKDILFKTGLIWRSSVIIPFNRVQHAEVHQGPLDRLFNLSQLKIYTAGGSSSDLTIPGLKPDVSNKIKHFILNKTASDEEE